MKAFFIIITTFFMGLNSVPKKGVIITSKNCSAELNVVKNRSFESIDYEKETSFTLLLKNTTSETTTYSISLSNLEQPCSNSNWLNSNKSSGTNVNLKVYIDSEDLHNEKTAVTEKEVTLRSGQSYKFKVNVSAHKGTPYYSWSCIEVAANSKNCNKNLVTTILSLYVTDPSEG